MPVTPHAGISAQGPVETSVEANAETPLEPVAAENSSSEEESFFAPSPEVEVPDQPAERAEERKALAGTHASAEKPDPSPLARPKHPAHPAAVRQAIDEVMEVIASLRESLEQLDEVLEFLEEAERQKTVDEREIESLRQQLRRFHRPPDEGSRHRPQLQQGAARESHRPQRDHGGQHRRPRDLHEPRASHVSHKAHKPHESRTSESHESSPAAASGEPPAGEQSASTHGTEAVDPS